MAKKSASKTLLKALEKARDELQRMIDSPNKPVHEPGGKGYGIKEVCRTDEERLELQRKLEMVNAEHARVRSELDAK